MEKITISVCMGSSCFSRGNNRNIDLVKQFVEENADKFELELKGNLCVGKCAQGPNIFINDKEFSGVMAENVYDILNSFLLK